MKNFKDKMAEVNRRFKLTGLQPCACDKFSYQDSKGCQSCWKWDEIEEEVDEEIYFESCNQN